MRQLGTCGVIAAIVLVLSTSTSQATVRQSSGDAAATRAYLNAEYAAVRAGSADSSAGIAALEALGEKLKGECPGVLANAPKPAPGARPTASETDISVEQTSAFFGALERVEHAELSHFARVVAHLRWSSHSLTRLVRSSAAEEAAQAGVQPPDLCADMRAWVASGYQSVSAGTKRYLHRLQVISEMTKVNSKPGSAPSLDAEEIIARRLAPFENRADKALVARTEHLEEKALRSLLSRLKTALEKASHALDAPAGT